MTVEKILYRTQRNVIQLGMMASKDYFTSLENELWSSFIHFSKIVRGFIVSYMSICRVKIYKIIANRGVRMKNFQMNRRSFIYKRAPFLKSHNSHPIFTFLNKLRNTF